MSLAAGPRRTPSQTRESLRANHLLVIAGPPCAGKTTLMSRLRGGQMPMLCDQLGVRDPREWTYVDATDLMRMSRTSVDRLVLHYDLIVQRSPHGYKHLPQILSQAGHVVLLTLWASQESLRLRSRARLADGVSSLLADPRHLPAGVRRLRNLWRRHLVFRSAAKVRRLYGDWFDFSTAHPTIPHWIADSTSGDVTRAERFEVARRRILSSLHTI